MSKSRVFEYRKELVRIKEEKKLRELLFYLFRKMKFENVEITHGPNEHGKDLVFSENNSFGSNDWYAVVVKLGKVTGGTNAKGNTVSNIRHQVELCFAQPYFFAKDNKQVYINRTIVVSNGSISAPAQIQIVENLKERANVSFWDISTLSGLMEDHLPDYFVNIDLFVSEYYEALNSDFEEVNELRSFSYKKELKKLIEIFIEPSLIITKSETVGAGTTLKPPVKMEVRKAHTLLESSENVLIVGEPGSGKSTLFREMILEIVKENKARSEYRILPILAKFKDVVDKGSVENALLSAISLHNPNKFPFNLEDKLSKGEACIFIDAFDEISDDTKRQQALDMISDFVQKYNQVRVIASSRNIDFVKQKEQVGKFQKMEVMPLNHVQMRSFITKWFSTNEAKKTKLLSSLKDTEIMNKLPKTPLVLTLVAILFDEREAEIPSNLTELYSMFSELLLGRWDHERNIESTFEYSIKDKMLRVLALKLHQQRVDEISDVDIRNIIAKHFEERGIEKNVSDFIKEIENRSQLLIKNSRNLYQFKHLSFQEYFASKELFETHADKNFVVERFLDLWWQNVIFFYCGRMKEAPEVFREIVEKVPFNNFTEMFRKLMGLGQTLQAAFETKTADKAFAIKHSLDIMVKVHDDILKGGNTTLKTLKKSSRFFVLELLSFLSELYFGSITLAPSLRQVFDELKNSLPTLDPKLTVPTIMKLYFIARTLSDIGQNDKLLEMPSLATSADLSLAYSIQLRIEAIKEPQSKSLYKDSLRTIKRRTSKWRKELIKELKTPLSSLKPEDKP